MLNISLFQMENSIGDLESNTKKIIDFYKKNTDKDLVLTPELSLCGYLPGDVIFTPKFKNDTNKSLDAIKKSTINKETILSVGSVFYENNKIYNCVLFYQNGELVKKIYKNNIPNYGVFQEGRYFSVKNNNIEDNILRIKNEKIALFICADIWSTYYINIIKNHEPNITSVICISASIFESNKNTTRVHKVIKNCQDHINTPVIYVNCVGNTDEEIFDGGSVIIAPNNVIVGYLPIFEEAYTNITLKQGEVSATNLSKETIDYSKNNLNLIYTALVFAFKNFIKRNKFKGVVLGMSGGIDSALCAAIACDALGSANVLGISMPYKYTSSTSLRLIEEAKQTLSIDIKEIPIASLYEAYEGTFSPVISKTSKEVYENLQARIRGQILMSIANDKKDFMLINTSNKSEIACGYSTIYGDTCGFYSIIKDIYKTQVFDLAHWRNSNIPDISLYKKENIIPEEIITRKPTAELRENQLDENSLPQYHILDDILYELIENKENNMVSCIEKFGEETVSKVKKLLVNSQYKRNQLCVGPVVSNRPLGKDFKLPTTSNYK